jgi:putative salt-induced outer membrane protein YdiY
MLKIRMAFFAAVILLSSLAGSALAADPEPTGWYFDAELASVVTAGNSESNTLGFGGKLRRLWTKSELTFRGGATSTESSLITRTAQGTEDDFTVQENKETTKTAELYFGRGWYQYNISPKFFAFSGVDWLSNKFAGIDSRVLVALGAGNTWADSDRVKFSTNYSVTYTFEEEVVENPFLKSDFAGARLGYNLDWKLSASTTFESDLVADWNLDNTDDVRLDWYNALPVSISETLQLKPAVRVFWRNAPALTTVPLFDGGGVPTDIDVATPLKSTDTIFTLALVVKLGPKAE